MQTRRVAGAAIALAAATLSIAPATAASVAPQEARACAWSAKIDPNLFNVAFPDQAAHYWSLVLPAVPGTSLVLRGRFPHSRYISFTSYDAQLRSADGINDTRIQPDPGSSNPFLVGASRTVPDDRRAYTVHVVRGQRPAQPAPNTLYTGSADGTHQGQAFTLLYRDYRQDRGLGDDGGVGLPSVSIASAAGEVPVPTCPFPDTPDTGINAALAGAAAPGRSATPDTTPPVWHKFYNLPTSGALIAADLVPPAAGATAVTTRTGAGGYLDNPDNKYVFTAVTPYEGSVVIIHALLPTTPATYDGEKVMTGAQLRYWSMCSNEFATQRFYGCILDDQLQLDASRHYTIVVSAKADRPANTRAGCGIDWLPAGGAPDTVLIERNMLADPAFHQSIQVAQQGHEKADLGAYYPAAAYTTTASVEALGCHAAGPADAAVTRVVRHPVSAAPPPSHAAVTTPGRLAATGGLSAAAAGTGLLAGAAALRARRRRATR
ncbi:MAG TPA: hypothetical protein VHE83_06715 [Mycobacteriales bacterium]|nr:hypothetical protein [Mycobacteriales bacterium]